MQVLGIQSYQHKKPHFGANLVGNNEAVKVVEKELAEFTAKCKQNHIKVPSVTFNDLQKIFEKQTQNSNGTFKLISAEDISKGMLDVVFLDSKGNVRPPDTKALIFPYELMPNEIFDGKNTFGSAIKTILNKVFNPNKSGDIFPLCKSDKLAS